MRTDESSSDGERAAGRQTRDPGGSSLAALGLGAVSFALVELGRRRLGEVIAAAIKLTHEDEAQYVVHEIATWSSRP